MRIWGEICATIQVDLEVSISFQGELCTSICKGSLQAGEAFWRHSL